MANNLGSLVVSLGLDAAEFTRGMTKGEYQAKQSVDRMKRDFDGLVKYVAGLGIGAALVQTVKSTADASKEIDRLAKLSATSAENFQAQAYAAQQAGISQEKLADIFKDTQDKVGDFLQNGAGPLKDFFDNIAPRVGVTADQFRNLSGPDALQLYVSSLEKANLSQAELTFYMEAIASDSALLLPLLKGNGAEMGRLADEAKRLGKVLDDETIAANKRFADQLDQLQASMQGVQRTIGSALIPWLQELADEFTIGIEKAGGFWNALSLGTINPFRSGAENIKVLREELRGLQGDRERYVRAGSDTSAIDQAIKSVETKIAYLGALERQAQVADNARLAAQFGKDNPKLNSLRARTEPYIPPKPGGGGGGGGGGDKPAGLTEAEKAQRDYDAFIKQAEDDRQAYLFRRAEKALQDEEALQKRYLDDLAQLEEDRQNYVFQRNLKRIEDEERAREDAAKRATQALEEQQRRLGDAFANTFGRAFDEGMKLGDLIKRLAFDAINIQFLTPAAQKAGNWLGSAVSSLFSFDGGGYTGAGSRSGGIDGKGGFLSVLHPNETVIDHTRGQSMGGGGGVSIVQTFNFGNASADTVAQLRAEAARIKAETLAAVPAAMVQAVRTSTGVARAMRGA